MSVEWESWLDTARCSSKFEVMWESPCEFHDELSTVWTAHDLTAEDSFLCLLKISLPYLWEKVEVLVKEHTTVSEVIDL